MNLNMTQNQDMKVYRWNQSGESGIIGYIAQSCDRVDDPVVAASRGLCELQLESPESVGAPNVESPPKAYRLFGGHGMLQSAVIYSREFTVRSVVTSLDTPASWAHEFTVALNAPPVQSSVVHGDIISAVGIESVPVRV